MLFYGLKVARPHNARSLRQLPDRPDIDGELFFRVESQVLVDFSLEVSPDRTGAAVDGGGSQIEILAHVPGVQRDHFMHASA